MNCDDVRDQLPDYWTGAMDEDREIRDAGAFRDMPGVPRGS